MTKKKHTLPIFNLDDVDKIQLKPQIDVTDTPRSNKILLSNALRIIEQQMITVGMRKSSIREYIYTMNRFINDMNLVYVGDIKKDVVLQWLSTLDCKDITRSSKLRVIKSILSKMYENGWIDKDWWKPLKIKVDTKIKPNADEQQLKVLLSLIDQSTYVGFRDTCMILLMYHCGLRAGTVIQLEEKHLDFDTNTLVLSGDVMKGRGVLKLPIPSELGEYLKRLIHQNNIIKKHYHKHNTRVFISKLGEPFSTDCKPSFVTKRLNYYSNKYGLDRISAHSIRRLFAYNLRKKGVDVVLISKSLNHQNLSTTTQYLNLSTDEVLDSLRKYIE